MYLGTHTHCYSGIAEHTNYILCNWKYHTVWLVSSLNGLNTTKQENTLLLFAYEKLLINANLTSWRPAVQWYILIHLFSLPLVIKYQKKGWQQLATNIWFKCSICDLGLKIILLTLSYDFNSLLDGRWGRIRGCKRGQNMVITDCLTLTGLGFFY